MTEKDGSERRSESRLDVSFTLYVEIVAAEPEMGRQAAVAIAQTVDVSANGLQVKLDQAPPRGAILPLAIETQGQLHHLVGEVKWVVPEGDGFGVGFFLYDSEGTQIADWKQYIAESLSDWNGH